MATLGVPMFREASSGSSSCASDRIAPYIKLPSLSFAEAQEIQKRIPASPRPPVLTLQPLRQTKLDRPLLLDDLTRARLLQLYTSRQPITNPKQIQSHFTCLYLTRANITEVLQSSSRPNSGLRCNSTTSPFPNRFADLNKLLAQSWRITFGTLDFLELVWTGKRSSKSWDSLLTSCSGHDNDESKPSCCPIAADEDEFLAFNMAVTYYYTPEGKPALSLVAIAMTRDAVEAIAKHVADSQQQRPMQHQQHQYQRLHLPREMPNVPAVHFDRIPFVHRDLLVPTLCRWRNADVATVLAAAAEGRAWSGKLLHDDHAYPGSGDDNSTEVEINGAWFFPTLKVDSSTKNDTSINTKTSSPQESSSSSSSPMLSDTEVAAVALLHPMSTAPSITQPTTTTTTTAAAAAAAADDHDNENEDEDDYTDEEATPSHPSTSTPPYSFPSSNANKDTDTDTDIPMLDVPTPSQPQLQPESQSPQTRDRNRNRNLNRNRNPSPKSESKPTQRTHELRAALVPGRDPVFRSVASRLSGLVDRGYVRRSCQIDEDNPASSGAAATTVATTATTSVAAVAASSSRRDVGVGIGNVSANAAATRKGNGVGVSVPFRRKRGV